MRYSQAGKTLEDFCEKFKIPFAETQAGKSACRSDSPYCVGGVGVTGNSAANTLAAKADLILAVGSRLTDFTTASKSLMGNPDVKVVSINAARFHAMKLDAVAVTADAKAALELLAEQLEKAGYQSGYTSEITDVQNLWKEEMGRLADYSYDQAFEPLIKAGYPGSIEEFAKMTGSSLTQTAAICKIRESIPDDAIVVGAAGSLPGDLQRMWTTNIRDAYHMEYGYSCMGYEIAGALGTKLAEPERESYAMVGDGSFLMLHSELITSLQEKAKINVLLFDNGGFGCINNLQMSNGIGNLATEFRTRDEKGDLLGDFFPIDFAKVAEGYGCKTYRVTNLAELEAALKDSAKETQSVLIDIKVLPKTMTDGYGAWWHVGIASTAEKDSVKEAYQNKETNRKAARRY